MIKKLEDRNEFDLDRIRKAEEKRERKTNARMVNTKLREDLGLNPSFQN